MPRIASSLGQSAATTDDPVFFNTATPTIPSRQRRGVVGSDRLGDLVGRLQPNRHDHLLPVRAGVHAQHAARQHRLHRRAVTVSRRRHVHDRHRDQPGGYAATAAGDLPVGGGLQRRRQKQRRHQPLGSEPEMRHAGRHHHRHQIPRPDRQRLLLRRHRPQGGVTIDLLHYRRRQRSVATTTTAANGTYSFTGLAAGTYYVQEVVPSGYIQTGGGPNGIGREHLLHRSTSRPARSTPATTSTTTRFRPARPPTSATPSTTTTACTTCQRPARQHAARGHGHGHVHGAGRNERSAHPGELHRAGDRPSTPPRPTSSRSIDEATGIFSPGHPYATVLIPNCYYQIDFVCGPAINVLGRQTQRLRSGQHQHFLHGRRSLHQQPTTAARRPARPRRLAAGTSRRPAAATGVPRPART